MVANMHKSGNTVYMKIHKQLKMFQKSGAVKKDAQLQYMAPLPYWKSYINNKKIPSRNKYKMQLMIL